MILEVLRFQVDAERRAAFIDEDREVWTRALKDQRGFLRKEVWLGDDPMTVTVGIWWESREALEAFPPELGRELGARMGVSAQLVESQVYMLADVVCCEL